jgi:prevent-host-death family protein
MEAIMRTVNMHEAKTHLSRLVAQAAKGEPFVIARAGKPLVKVTAIENVPVDTSKRFGFMKGQMKVPDDIKAFAREEIEEMFYGKSE